MKEYTVKTFEEELSEDYYKILTPDHISQEEVMNAFQKAVDYGTYANDFREEIALFTNMDIEKIYEIHKHNFAQYIEMGKNRFDEYFEDMLEVEYCNKLEVFRYYITECKQWEMKDITYDFEFEW